MNEEKIRHRMRKTKDTRKNGNVMKKYRTGGENKRVEKVGKEE